MTGVFRKRHRSIFTDLQTNGSELNPPRPKDTPSTRPHLDNSTSTNNDISETGFSNTIPTSQDEPRSYSSSTSSRIPFFTLTKKSSSSSSSSPFDAAETASLSSTAGLLPQEKKKRKKSLFAPSPPSEKDLEIAEKMKERLGGSRDQAVSKGYSQPAGYKGGSSAGVMGAPWS